MNIMAPRGTNDILPPFSLHWQFVESVTRTIMSNFNYYEIRTPIFEYTELFQRGIGEVTDIVEKEMYTFEDKGGRSITLRPEGTASVVRSYMENKVYGQAQPVKYYYIGPMFRYERPQAGRFRQFYQLGAEVLGTNDPAIDAEVISLGLDILKELGLSNLDVYINSIGCPRCRQDYIQVLREYLQQRQDELCDDCQSRMSKNTLRVLDCKADQCSSIIKAAPVITDYLCEECTIHFDQVKGYLELIEINYLVDPTLVRGLDYYSNTAFEIKYKKLGAQDTVFAGGRYNGLVEEIGGKTIPGIGFAMGMERLMLTLEEQGIKLPVDMAIDLYIASIGDKAKRASFKYAQKLRSAGLGVEIDYLERSIKSQMKAADRLNASYTIILGEDELNSGSATIKNMKTGEQEMVKLDKLPERMQQLV